MPTLRFDDVAVGDQVGPLPVAVTRADLVRYAGASGDFNPIHWNERFAREVGLPDVIAHGMLTMALAGRLVTGWAGEPSALVDYRVRFTRPVPVPDDGVGATVELAATVKEKLDGNRVRLDVTAHSGGQKVLGRASAIVQLA